MNYKYLTTLIWFVAFLLSNTVVAQPPKREFRAAWVATVGNIDWPSRKGLSADQQRAEFINILNSHQQAGINAVIVQIRSVCDALYASPLEPWADVLTGQQGQSPGYDPLAFMIGECRKRGIEFHAWFNPYRAVSNIQTATLDPTHIIRRQPNWLLSQGALRILNPGLPEVRQYVTRVVMDVVRRYDIDGVHFDDYFYPYPPAAGTAPFTDDSTFVLHNRGFTNRADWRRDNVNILVQQVSDSIRAVKPWVKFGISPFGIWQNRSTSQPAGSATNGLQSYTDIYADSRRWIQAGWLDYIAPQLYWHIGNPAADYGVLVPWWDGVMKQANGRHLYIGQAVYRIGGAGEPAGWQQPNQMPTQLRLNRQTTTIQGSIFYNSTSFRSNPLGLRDSLQTNFYVRPALLPAMPWKDNVSPSAPSGLTAVPAGNAITLRWTKPPTGTAVLDRVRQFVIYRFDGNNVGNQNTAQFIRAITASDTTAFTDSAVTPGGVYMYLVTALDRLHNESAPSNPVQTQLILGDEPGLVSQFLNAPNPFERETELRYRLAKRADVVLVVTDLLGREVARLVNATLPPGDYRLVWAADGLVPGMYVAVLTVNGQKAVRRLVKI